MMNDLHAAALVGEREIATSRLLDAPRELVWQVWTDPKHVAQWWGPNGFTNTIEHMEVRSGGVWRFIMHGPDGTDYPNKIVYLEVVKPERLVYKHGGEEDNPAADFYTTVTFTEEGGKTRLTMRAVFASAAARDFVIKSHHAVEGMNQTMDRLRQYLADAR